MRRKSESPEGMRIVSAAVWVLQKEMGEEMLAG